VCRARPGLSGRPALARRAGVQLSHKIDRKPLLINLQLINHSAIPWLNGTTE
jgi:hypothetical protein